MAADGTSTLARPARRTAAAELAARLGPWAHAGRRAALADALAPLALTRLLVLSSALVAVDPLEVARMSLELWCFMAAGAAALAGAARRWVA